MSGRHVSVGSVTIRVRFCRSLIFYGLLIINAVDMGYTRQINPILFYIVCSPLSWECVVDQWAIFWSFHCCSMWIRFYELYVNSRCLSATLSSYCMSTLLFSAGLQECELRILLVRQSMRTLLHSVSSGYAGFVTDDYSNTRGAILQEIRFSRLLSLIRTWFFTAAETVDN